MKWVSNTYDPQRADARQYVSKLLNETTEEAWQHHLEWLKDKIIGEPQGTRLISAEDLKKMGLVGVYLPD